MAAHRDHLGRRIRGDDRGQALVEWVIVFPAFLLFFLCIWQVIEIGQAYFFTEYAAFSSARSYSVYKRKFDLRENIMDASASLAMLPVNEIAVRIFHDAARAGSGGAIAYGLAHAGASLTSPLFQTRLEVDVEEKDGYVQSNVTYWLPLRVPLLGRLWTMVKGGDRLTGSLSLGNDMALSGLLDGQGGDAAEGRIRAMLEGFVLANEGFSLPIRATCLMGMEAREEPWKNRQYKDRRIASCAAAGGEASEDCAPRAPREDQILRECMACNELKAAYQKYLQAQASNPAQAKAALDAAKARYNAARSALQAALSGYNECLDQSAGDWGFQMPGGISDLGSNLRCDMEDPKKETAMPTESNILQKVLGPIRGLRGDERGQLLMPGAVMVFFLFFVFVYAMNMNGMLRRRIELQNAVDAGAEAGALWQARGANAVQMLNNLHYNANSGLASLMNLAHGICALYRPAQLCCAICLFGAPAACTFMTYVACPSCKALPLLDNLQSTLSKVILATQSGIVKIFPVIAFLSADEYARKNKADGVVSVLADILGLQFRLPGALGQFLRGLEPHIFPLNPAGLLDPPLGLQKQSSNLMPWTFRPFYFAQNIAKPDCYASDPRDGQYGWENDQYYCGNPIVITWVAGGLKTNELLRLGSLPWLTSLYQKYPDLETHVGSPEEIGKGGCAGAEHRGCGTRGSHPERGRQSRWNGPTWS